MLFAAAVDVVVDGSAAAAAAAAVVAAIPVVMWSMASCSLKPARDGMKRSMTPVDGGAADGDDAEREASENNRVPDDTLRGEVGVVPDPNSEGEKVSIR